MKKTIVLILLILPIFLMITISFAGRVFAIYNHVYVESVYFVDELENKIDKNEEIKLDIGETFQTKIKIYPELATNKNVTYVSQKEKICTIDENGLITGVAYGTTSVIVKTEDGDKTASILIRVTKDNVTGVTLSTDNMNLAVGEIQTLYAEITPETALNKNVKWDSSDATVVSVDANGKLKALKEGEATIIVTTVDGGYTDTCSVVVSATKKSPLEFTIKPLEGSSICFTSEQVIILKNYLTFDPEVISSLQTVKFAINSGDNYATVDETTGVITFKTANKTVYVVAYVGDKNNPTYQAEIKFIWQNNN